MMQQPLIHHEEQASHSITILGRIKQQNTATNTCPEQQSADNLVIHKP